jgi:hypothetical protein
VGSCSWNTGEFLFSEGTSAKWISDVEIEKLRPENFIHVEKTKIILGVVEKLLISSHTSGPRDVPRCGALSLLQKTLQYRGGSS